MICCLSRSHDRPWTNKVNTDVKCLLIKVSLKRCHTLDVTNSSSHSRPHTIVLTHLYSHTRPHTLVLTHSSSAAEKMTPIGLLVLGLAALLAPGLAVDVNNLREVVNQLLNRFEPTLPNSNKSPIFSLVVRVPQDQNSWYDVSQIEDDATNVKKKILQDCDVYLSKRLIAATVLQSWNSKKCKSKKPITGHAESRVLQKFAWNNPDDSELLLFYTSSSPCNGTCTNKNSQHNILKSIKVINEWPSHALVFSNIFQPANRPPITQENLAQSLKNLAESVGPNNIYRCLLDKCKPCFNNVGVDKFCVSDEIFSQQSQGSWPLSSQDQQKTDRSGSSRSLSPQRGSEAEWGERSSRSPSRWGSQDRGRSQSPVRSNTKPLKNRRSQSPVRSNTKPLKNRRSQSPVRSNTKPLKNRRSQSPVRSNTKPLKNRRSQSPVRSNTKPLKNRRSQSLVQSNTKPLKNRLSQSPVRSNTKSFYNRRSRSPLRSNSKPFKNRRSRSPSRARSHGWGYRMVFS